MTILDSLNEAYSMLFNVVFHVNKYTKKGKDVPADLLAKFGAAYEQVCYWQAQLDAALTR